MKNLYGIVKVSKFFPEEEIHIEKHIKYYKLEGKKFGIRIVERDRMKREKIEIENITDNEEKIDKVLTELVVKEIRPQASDVIEDLIKIYV